MLESISQNWLVRWGLPYLYSVNWSYLVNVGLSTNITSKKITCKGNPQIPFQWQGWISGVVWTVVTYQLQIDPFTICEIIHLSIVDWPFTLCLWKEKSFGKGKPFEIFLLFSVHSIKSCGRFLFCCHTNQVFHGGTWQPLWDVAGNLGGNHATKSCHKGVRLSFGSVWPNPRPMQPEFHWFQNCFWSIPTLAQ